LIKLTPREGMAVAMTFLLPRSPSPLRSWRPAGSDDACVNNAKAGWVTAALLTRWRKARSAEVSVSDVFIPDPSDILDSLLVPSTFNRRFPVRITRRVTLDWLGCKKQAGETAD